MDPARPSFQLNGPGAAGGNLWSGPFLQFGAGGSAAARSLLAQSRSFQFEIRQPRQSTGGRPTLRCTKNKSARSGSVVRSQGRGGSLFVQPTPPAGRSRLRVAPRGSGPFCIMRGRVGCDLRHTSTALRFRSSLSATATSDAPSGDLRELVQADCRRERVKCHAA